MVFVCGVVSNKELDSYLEQSKTNPLVYGGLNLIDNFSGTNFVEQLIAYENKEFLKVRRHIFDGVYFHALD
jgi:hypothetical protein